MTRRGLVLGAGGVLGFTWAVGALTAIEQEEGFDCRDVEMIVGTSAGSITAALLGCRLPVEAMLRHQRRIPAPGDPAIPYDDDTEHAGALPPRPAFSLGSPSLMAHTARHPLTVTPFAALSSVAPRGRGSLEPIRRVVDIACGGAEWTPHPSVWIMAMDYASGRRVAFGRSGAPSATLSQAVAASCAIPGWFTPVEIGGQRYVDGGTRSSTSLDLVAGHDLDEVYVVAPMASLAFDRPHSLVARIERRIRRAIARRVLREAEKVRAGGTRVILLGPGPEDLEAIGANMMDAGRRDEVLATSLRTSVAALRRGPGTYALDDTDNVAG